MSSLQEEQRPIDAAIVSAMVESTPEIWTKIVLTLTRSATSTQLGAFVHEISSPEGYPPVGAADSLFDATYRLDELFRRHNATLARAVYSAALVSENWSFLAEYEYS